jgi:hypothetical protein
MRKYTVNKSLATSATAATNTMPIGIQGSATKGIQVYDLYCSFNAVVQDIQVLVGLSLCSTYVAGTAFTANPLEIGDVASSATATTTLTVGSQVLTGTPLWEQAFNTRGSIRMVVPDPDSRIILPAGANAAGSIILYNQQASTIACTLDNQIYFAE